MGFAFVLKAVLLLQLSLFVFSDEEIEVSSPIPSPGRGNSHAPTLAPTGHHHHHHHAHSPNLAPGGGGGHHHHHGHALVHSPVHPPMPHSRSPVHPPAHSPHPRPPAHSPVQPPKPQPQPPTYHFPRSFVSVQGVVFCKSCKYAGVDTLLGASPLSGIFFSTLIYIFPTLNALCLISMIYFYILSMLNTCI